MKKFLTIALFAATTAAMAQTGLGVGASPSNTQQQGTQTGNQSAPAGAQPGASDQQQKVIKDQAEYNAYMTATTTQDPGQKAQSLEAFVQQYPNSVVKEDALEAAMAAYQQAGNVQKMADTASRILQLDPNNVIALFITVYTRSQNNDIAGAAPFAERGIEAMRNRKKPDGVTQEQFDQQQKLFAAVFNTAIGQRALAQKDYPKAQQSLGEAVKMTPNDVNVVYNLAVAYLGEPKQTTTDQKKILGLWYLARASALAPPQAQQQILPYGRKAYAAFHGSEDGWDQLIAQAKNNPEPPAQLQITKYTPPSPADQAAQMINGKDPLQLSPAEWIFILGSGNQQAAQQVWDAIKGKAIKFEGFVVASTTTDVALSVTLNDDNSYAQQKDVIATFAKPVKIEPQVGKSFSLQAVAASMTQNPASIQMTDAIPLGESAKQVGIAPAKKAPVRRRVTRKRAH